MGAYPLRRGDNAQLAKVRVAIGPSAGRLHLAHSGQSCKSFKLVCKQEGEAGDAAL